MVLMWSEGKIKKYTGVLSANDMFCYDIYKKNDVFVLGTQRTNPITA